MYLESNAITFFLENTDYSRLACYRLIIKHNLVDITIQIVTLEFTQYSALHRLY